MAATSSRLGEGTTVTVPDASAKPGLLGSLLRAMERRFVRDDNLQVGEAPEHGTTSAEIEDGGRRGRRLGVPQEILDRSLSQKVLHGWLQNRHQVLVPLTFRLGRLEPDDVELLMRFTAVALLNGSTADAASQRPVERWLHDIGAADAAVAGFRAGLASPAPLSTLVAKLRERELSAYAYAAAVVAADTQEASGRLFANFIAARLGLPADAVRSIDRRYRR